jgi:hypothetical protein
MAQRASNPDGIVVRRGQPIYVVPDVDENGETIERVFTDDGELDAWIERRGLDLKSFAGIWDDVDWEAMAEALDRIRHESKPTPSIDDL